MSNFSQLFGGGGSGVATQFATVVSGTFTCPVSGFYLVTAIGGGSAGTNSGRGGGAGGLAQSLVYMTAGYVITYTAGAGGAASAAAGGNTTCTGPGLSLTTNGGSPTAGGTASGGNLRNIQGGTSGVGSNTGGAAVGVYGIGYGTTTSNNGGGAGVGGTNSTIYAGSALGPASAALDGPGIPATFLGGRLLEPVSGNATSYPGCGGRGDVTSGGNGGIFAGGGGSASAPGNGGLFGGGGGGGGTVNASNGRGGPGGIIIEYTTK